MASSISRHHEPSLSQLLQLHRLLSLGQSAGELLHTSVSPLTVSILNLENLEVKISSLPKEYRDHLLPLLRSSLAATERLEEIVTTARAQIQATDDNNDSCNPYTISSLVLELFSNRIQQNKIATELFCNTSTVINIPGYFIYELISNLVCNSIDAIYRGPTDKKSLIRISIAREKQTISIGVTDNGRGIEEDVLPFIFEPFFSTPAQPDRLGLGLTVCKKIVEDLRGHISVESSPSGTTFTTALPLSQPPKKQ